MKSRDTSTKGYLGVSVVGIINSCKWENALNQEISKQNPSVLKELMFLKQCESHSPEF